MRVATARGGIEADRRQHLGDAVLPFAGIAHAMDQQTLGQRAADAPPGIEGGAGILMDVLDDLARAPRRLNRLAAD